MVNPRVEPRIADGHEAVRHERALAGGGVGHEQIEIADWFAGAAMAILCLAGLGSLVWAGRLP